MARIGYGKVGRSFNLNPTRATSVGGDIDVLNLLKRLAAMFPQHTFVLVGKNSGEVPQEVGYPANVENPWTAWRENWTSVPDPSEADKMIDHFRSISGDFHTTLDAMVMWAGQHGSANSRIPMIGSDWITPPGWDESVDGGTNAHNDVITGGIGENLATPQYAFVHYCSWLMDFLGRWREAGGGPLTREEVWLCPDPRNYLKIREKRWPLAKPVIAQYQFLKYHKGERFGRFPDELYELDPTGYKEESRWVTNTAYAYGALELTAVGSPDQIKFDPVPGSHAFGMVVNENLTNVKDSRLQLLKSWVLPNFPDAEIRGHWTEKSQLELNRIFQPVPYTEVMGVMKSFATTLTTPASGSGWATAKPWEAFALGSICFFHPRYDDQAWILPKAGIADTREWDEDAKMLGEYLRVSSPEQLAARVAEVTSNPDLYHAIVTAQRRHYEKSFAYWQGGARTTAERLLQELGELGDQEGYWLETPDRPGAKVSSRAEARPRGTNEERKKKKPPISRRRALRGGLPPEIVDEPGAEETPVEEASTPPEELVAIDIETAGLLSTYPPLTQLSINETALTKSVVMSWYETPRASKDRYFVDMAKHVATQSTCARRDVGCVLVNKNKRVLATGFNGVPRGMPHCNEGHPCAGADAPSGQRLHQCLSAHAEINALLQCPDVDDVETVYLTVSPCTECIKAIMNTGATRIVFEEEYVQVESKQLWLSRPGNVWIKLGSDE